MLVALFISHHSHKTTNKVRCPKTLWLKEVAILGGMILAVNDSVSLLRGEKMASVLLVIKKMSVSVSRH